MRVSIKMKAAGKVIVIVKEVNLTELKALRSIHGFDNVVILFDDITTAA